MSISGFTKVRTHLQDPGERQCWTDSSTLQSPRIGSRCRLRPQGWSSLQNAVRFPTRKLKGVWWKAAERALATSRNRRPMSEVSGKCQESSEDKMGRPPSFPFNSIQSTSLLLGAIKTTSHAGWVFLPRFAVYTSFSTDTQSPANLLGGSYPDWRITIKDLSVLAFKACLFYTDYNWVSVFLSKLKSFDLLIRIFVLAKNEYCILILYFTIFPGFYHSILVFCSPFCHILNYQFYWTTILIWLITFQIICLHFNNYYEDYSAFWHFWH